MSQHRANASPHTGVTLARKGPGTPPVALQGRWNIRRLLCFSHDGRRRDVDLELGTVNIITGNSHTGKSALSDLIDYVMGSQDCNLPGRVFGASAWVGILWQNGTTQCLICRRVPQQRPRGTDDFIYQVGTGIDVPQRADELSRTIGRDSMLRRFESLLGIGDVKTELFGSEARDTVRVSFRNAMPYLLQDAQHIINRNALLRGMDTQQRQHLLDTLPYYLGVVDESTVARQGQLRQLKAQIVSEERRIASSQAIVGAVDATARQLGREAADAGMMILPTDGASYDQLNAALEEAVARTADLPEVFTTDAALTGLYERERVMAARGARLRGRIEATRRALDTVGSFVDASEAQRQRLEIVDLLPEPGDANCPLCSQPVQEQGGGPGAVRRAVERIRQELGEVARERPKLDGTLVALEEERAALARELAEVRASIRATVEASEFRQRAVDLDRQRLVVAGRISLYLQSAAQAPVAVQAVDDLDDLRAHASALAAELDAEAKLELLDVARTRLSGLATEIAASLPFESSYVGQPVDVNLRTLSVSVITATQREDMRAIGSDENALTLHVAVLLALHRVFYERARPVPGFLLLDQLSRPYYPPTGGETEEEVESAQPEVASLKQYFDVLFSETGRGTGLQILVLEHAYFSDDNRFRNATRERWIRGQALIPEDWPNRS